jgi:quercetin dioxygenase-like cupin family protein
MKTLAALLPIALVLLSTFVACEAETPRPSMGSAEITSASVSVQYVKLITDESGETHFADLAVDLASTDFAPPASPLNISAFTPATQYGYMHLPKGWIGDWHPSPARQILFILSGEGIVEASDGERRGFRAGDILLLEDTTGKGHFSKAGPEGALIAVVQL